LKNEIWKWFGREYKVHCEKREDYVKITSWTGCRPGGLYLFPDRHVEYDVIISPALYNRVAELLALPTRPVCEKRRIHGQIMAETNKEHRFLRKTISK
jgi:hypothetical protein